MRGEGFDLDGLSTEQLRRYLLLTEEATVVRLDEETLAEKVPLEPESDIPPAPR